MLRSCFVISKYVVFESVKVDVILVIFGYNPIRYIMLINSSVNFCLFGFNRSILKSPQIKMVLGIANPT